MSYRSRHESAELLGEASKNRPLEKKSDADLLHDRDLERLTLSLREKGKTDNTARNHNAQAAAPTAEHAEERLKYKHYRFDGEWAPLSSDSGEDVVDDPWFIAAPEVLAEEDPGYLCEMCRHVNFQALLDQRGIAKEPITLVGLGRVMQEKGNACGFCRLLRRKITEGNLAAGIDDLERRLIVLRQFEEGPDHALRIEVKLDTMRERTPRRFLLHRLKQEPQKPLTGRLVRQEQADMDVLREWLRLCELTPTAASRDLQGIASLRVMDTKELRICEVDMSCTFACLSYVWGKGSQVQYTKETREALEAYGGLEDTGLPQTIRDAIKVTQEVGIRYLWVDALCIIQDDAADKAKIISKMGHIYGGAALTIIASANTDPQHGLPGMGTAHRTLPQMTTTIQGIMLAAVLDDPRKPVPSIEQSVWSSRAWTFQERALSRRSVFFTESQMIFKAKEWDLMFEDTVPVPSPTFRHSLIKEELTEALIPHLWTDKTLGRYPSKGFSFGEGYGHVMMSSGDDTDDSAPIFDITISPIPSFMGSLNDLELGGSNTTPWDIYRLAVDDYTKRKLSREADAVDAFEGVQHLIRQGTNTKSWYGLPSFAFEKALLWQPDGFLERRATDGEPLFPSWSWAAWKGHVSYRGRGWKNSVLWESTPVVQWVAQVEPQWLLDYVERFKDMAPGEMEAFKRDVLAHSGSIELVPAPSTLRDPEDTNKDGWRLHRDEVHNRHLYTNEAYPGMKFTFPICLPGQEVDDRPDENGTLVFYAHVIPVAVCDMKETTAKAKVEDSFLQLGLNDEDRSANYRRPWQRIIYHQGYRVGFVSLNTPCLDKERPADDDDEEGCQYQLAAISRGSAPTTPPPPFPWELYWRFQPHMLQLEHFKEEWVHQGKDPSFNINEGAEKPSDEREIENGEANWDQERFGHQRVFDVYDVLLLKTATKDGLSQRVGVGKVNRSGFLAAHPREMRVNLV